MVAFLLDSGAKATRRTLVNTIIWGTAPGPRPDEASTKIMRQLITAGALKGIPEGESALLLILACQKQNPAILAELLQAGLNRLAILIPRPGMVPPLLMSFDRSTQASTIRARHLYWI